MDYRNLLSGLALVGLTACSNGIKYTCRPINEGMDFEVVATSRGEPVYKWQDIKGMSILAGPIVNEREDHRWDATYLPDTSSARAEFERAKAQCKQ